MIVAVALLFIGSMAATYFYLGLALTNKGG
jgi:hypothetical protein